MHLAAAGWRLRDSKLLRRNILANLLGRGVNLLVGLILLPVYLHILGIEVVGLIGFYTTLLALMGVVDTGLSGLVLRQIGRRSNASDHAQDRRDLLRTTEVAYVVMGILIGGGCILAAPDLANRWQTGAGLDHDTIARSIILMGWTVALQLPFMLHTNALNGLERQIPANLLLVLFGVGRGLVTLAVLYFVSATAEAYFRTQLIATVLSALTSFFVVWRVMPRARAAAIRPSLVFGDWRYTIGLTANAVVFILLIQSDKLIVTALASLETFGYYALASLIASLSWSVVGPINTALLPRFTRLLEAGSEQEICRLFHVASQFNSLLLLPAAVIAVFHGEALTFVWTGRWDIAAQLHPLLPLLYGGVVMWALICVSNALQLAAGWPYFALYTNLGALVVVMPLSYVLTAHFGVVAAASAWVFIGGLQLIVPPIFLHRRILKNERMRWYLHDLGLPAAAAVMMGLLSQAFISMPQSRIAIGLQLILIWSLTSAAVMAACPTLWMPAWQLCVRFGARIQHLVRLPS